MTSNQGLRETQASYNMQSWGPTSLNSISANRESVNPFSPAKDISLLQSPARPVNVKVVADS